MTDSTLPDSSIKPPTPFVPGVSNSFQRVVTAAIAIGAVADLFTELFQVPAAAKDFIVPDLAGNGDLGYGTSNSAGGLRNTPSLIRYGTNNTPDEDISKNNIPVGYRSIEYMINKSLSIDWQTKNADPGNPNILEAYQLSGRNFTRDGRTNEFSWATAYLNWILSKAGVQYLETMSPRGYEKYGTPVNFRTMREVRKYDIFIFKSNQGISHIGFVTAYDPRTKTLDIVGGNQAGKVKVTKMPFSTTDLRFYTIHVKRNWAIPSEFDVPLFSDDIVAVSPLSDITVQPLPPVGASAAELAEFNRRYPPVSTSNPRAQFGPYSSTSTRPTVDDINRLANAAINRAEQNPPPAPTRSRDF